MTQLSHVDDQGRIRMVDTSDKDTTARRAVASARVVMSAATVAALREHRTPKGDPLEAARLAGIMAAKRTADLIPLCHPLPLTHIEVRAELTDSGISLKAEVATKAQTGVASPFTRRAELRQEQKKACCEENRERFGAKRHYQPKRKRA